MDLIAEKMQLCGAITRADIEAIGDELAKLGQDDFLQQAGWIAEGIWLIIADCLYQGDAKLSDLRRIMERAEAKVFA